MITKQYDQIFDALNFNVTFAEQLYQQRGLQYLLDEIDKLTDTGEVLLPADWARQNRYMPSEITENYGMWDATDVPQLIEPLNRVHPDDPTTHIALMKSVQSAGTVSFLENALGFWTKYKLGSASFFTSSKGVGKVRSSSALDVMIDNGGLADLLKPISTRSKRKSADTAMYKEFAGGVKWLISSYNSIGDMKSNTFNLMLLDEWDEAGEEISDQGDIEGILEGRTMATRMYKMLQVSTPSRMETSRIYKGFINGDQRRYFVPCPICGDPQILVLKANGRKHGLTFNMTRDANTGAKILDVNSVRYICEHCKREFFEESKKEICNKGEWRETWKGSGHAPKTPNHKSYHASGLISQFLPWARICERFVRTDFGKDIPNFKDFTINFLGEPWARIKNNISWEKVKQRAEDYCMGEIPPGSGWFLYMGVDVQNNRLEGCVVAVGGENGIMEKHIIDYVVFSGEPADENDANTWGALHHYVYNKTFPTPEGCEMRILCCAVDSGFDAKQRRQKDWTSKEHTVYNFVATRQDKFIAIKGVKESTGTGVIVPVKNKHPRLTTRYEISTSVIKELLFQRMNETGGEYSLHVPKYKKEGFVEVPIGDAWYKQLVSERYQEVSPGKFGWKKIFDRNEVLDTTVYAVALMYRDNLNAYDDPQWWIDKKREIMQRMQK